MKNSYPTWVAPAFLSAVLLLVPVPGEAQLPRDPVERAKVIAQVFQANAGQLTLFDRAGKEVGVVGPRDLYNQPVLSPDSRRVAVIRADLDRETNDLWVFDVATGKGIQITSSQPREGASSPAWSPDGSQVAYAALRTARFGLYRNASSGDGPEELLYQSSEAPGPGAAVQVSKNGAIGMIFWRQDGKEMYFLTRDWEVMAVDVSTTPTFQAGAPRLLFKLPGPLPGNPTQWKNVSRDGQQFIFAMPIAAAAPAR